MVVSRPLLFRRNSRTVPERVRHTSSGWVSGPMISWPAAKWRRFIACVRPSASRGLRRRNMSTWRMYHVHARGAVDTMHRYVNVPAMPTEPRVVPIPCPFGQTGGVVYVYYIDAPQPALVDTGVAASPEATIGPALRSAGIALEDVR